MRGRLAALIVAAGTVATLSAAIRVDMLGDALALAGVAVAAASAVGVVGAVLLGLMRRRSLGVQILVVSLVSVAGTVVGVQASAQRMFVSGHDRDVLVVVATAAATVGLLAALVLGDRIARSSRAVADLASRIGDGRWSGGSVVEPVAGEFVGLSADLTRMAERLQAASEREKRLEASRRELVAWVSHDLRTPLAAIRAMVEAIEDGVVADPAVIERYHRDIGSEVQRLTALVDDLFMLSRIDSGALDRVREPVPIADLVSDAVAAVGPLAAQREVTVRGQRGHDDPIVWGSASDLARILHNLLDNALCHTPPSGRVSVRVGSGPAGRGDAVVIEVDDSGPGVPAADREAIFEVGRTGDSARSRGSGSGLGLAIARGLVEAHGGTISVGSSPELGGARLSVVLPVEGAAAEPVR